MSPTAKLRIPGHPGILATLPVTNPDMEGIEVKMVIMFNV
jgi:hypothetical protein